jgi:hypothetical protein
LTVAESGLAIFQNIGNRTLQQAIFTPKSLWARERVYSTSKSPSEEGGKRRLEWGTHRDFESLR